MSITPNGPIIGETKLEAGLVEHVRLNKRQYLTADRDRVVDEGDEEAAFFFGGPGQLVPRNEAEKVGASFEGEGVSGDDLKDVVHVEVETPNVNPGPRVEGSGKATIPVTQADRVAAGDARRRAAVSGKDRRKSEGEEFLAGNLKRLPDQTVVGEAGQRGQEKQLAQMEPAHYAEGEKEEVKGSDQAREEGVKTQQPQPTESPDPGAKQAEKQGDKSATSPSQKNK